MQQKQRSRRVCVKFGVWGEYFFKARCHKILINSWGSEGAIKQPKSAVSQRQYEAKEKKYWFVEDKTPHLGEFLLLYY